MTLTVRRLLFLALLLRGTRENENRNTASSSGDDDDDAVRFQEFCLWIPEGSQWSDTQDPTGEPRGWNLAWPSDWPTVWPSWEPPTYEPGRSYYYDYNEPVSEEPVYWDPEEPIAESLLPPPLNMEAGSSMPVGPGRAAAHSGCHCTRKNIKQPPESTVTGVMTWYPNETCSSTQTIATLKDGHTVCVSSLRLSSFIEGVLRWIRLGGGTTSPEGETANRLPVDAESGPDPDPDYYPEYEYTSDPVPEHGHEYISYPESDRAPLSPISYGPPPFPAPVPVPESHPDPGDHYVPDPDSTPFPAPAPDPVPVPVPESHPDPGDHYVPFPFPDPVPDPDPVPVPESHPDPDAKYFYHYALDSTPPDPVTESAPGYALTHSPDPGRAPAPIPDPESAGYLSGPGSPQSTEMLEIIPVSARERPDDDCVCSLPTMNKTDFKPKDVDFLAVLPQPFPCSHHFHVHLKDGRIFCSELIPLKELVQKMEASLSSMPKTSVEGCRCSSNITERRHETTDLLFSRIWPATENCSMAEVMDSLIDGSAQCFHTPDLQLFLNQFDWVVHIMKEGLIEPEPYGGERAVIEGHSYHVRIDVPRVVEPAGCIGCLPPENLNDIEQSWILSLSMKLHGPGCPAIIDVTLKHGNKFCVDSSQSHFWDLLKKL